MIAPTVGLYMVMATSMGMVPAVVSPVCDACATCDPESMKVHQRIIDLQSSPGLIGRRKAARALGNYDWRLYPEAAEALAGALLHDPRPLVRQQAASSLARMRPCLPTVHHAVAQAVREDSCLISRHAAKRALRAIDAALEKEEVIVFSDEREILLPAEIGPEILSPTTTIRPAPSPPPTISPFAPGAEYEVPTPSPVPPPSPRLEGPQTWSPPEPAFDRYDLGFTPYHGEIQPDVFDFPADSPPNVAWPSGSVFDRVTTFPRPNYASSLLGVQP